MSNDLSIFETVIIFLVILLLAFCCGFLRSLRLRFGKRDRSRGRVPRLPAQVIDINRRRYPTVSTIAIETEMVLRTAVPAEEQINPPPYSAVPNILPPTYDEAMKLSNDENQNANNLSSSSTRQSDEIDKF